MRITDIRFLPGDGVRVLARVSITLDDMLVLHGLAVMPGRQGGLHLAMPRHTHRDGTVRDTAHPINRETREYLERHIFAAYAETLSRSDLPQRSTHVYSPVTAPAH